MSGPTDGVPGHRDDPALDHGVLLDAPLLEFHGWTAVARHGGVPVLPWRPQARAAEAFQPVPHPPAGTWPQALVRLTKGRAGVMADVAAAWQAVAPGARLTIVGAKELGIASHIRRLNELLGPGAILAQRAHQTVAAWTRREAITLPAPPSTSVPLGDDSTTMLTVPPGVFSGDGLDAGTAALLAVLPQLPAPHRVADLGCGAGHLGLAALRRWTTATAWMGEADHRAVMAAQTNAEHLGVAQRVAITWWDAAEPLPGPAYDLILCNPPCHAGAAVSCTVAESMFRSASAALTLHGALIVVANRQLPYEQPLARCGRLTTLVQDARFKVLHLSPHA